MIDSEMKLKPVFSFPPLARKHSRIIDENVQTTLHCYTAVFTTKSVTPNLLYAEYFFYLRLHIRWQV